MFESITVGIILVRVGAAEAGLAREVRFGDGLTHYEHNYKHEPGGSRVFVPAVGGKEF